MTPEQLKKKPFKPIIKVNTNEKLDTEEGESNTDEEKSTTSRDMSEQDFASDTTTDDSEGSEPTVTHQVHNVLNDTTHDQDDSSEDENVIEIEPHSVNGEKNNQKRTNSLQPTLKLKLETEKLETENLKGS